VTVIADTSPLQYAVEIDVAPSIFMLYGRIVVPAAVSSEMRHRGAPLLLRRWVRTTGRRSRFASSRFLTILDSLSSTSVIVAHH
jgi:hypothetical protein